MYGMTCHARYAMTWSGIPCHVNDVSYAMPFHVIIFMNHMYMSWFKEHKPGSVCEGGGGLGILCIYIRVPMPEIHM